MTQAEKGICVAYGRAGQNERERSWKNSAASRPLRAKILA